MTLIIQLQNEYRDFFLLNPNHLFMVINYDGISWLSDKIKLFIGKQFQAAQDTIERFLSLFT